MREEIYKERIELRLTEKQKDKIKKISHARSITMNQLIRDLIESL